MNEVQEVSSSALFAGRRHTSVSRGLGEFRARRPVVITARGEAMLALPGVNADNRRYMAVKAAPAEHRLDHLTASLADHS